MAAKKLRGKAAQAKKYQPPGPNGRPSKYTEDLATEILDRLCAGEFLTKICEDAHMPAMGTVMRWLGEPDRDWFRNGYEKARMVRIQRMADETAMIADGEPPRVIRGEDGVAAVVLPDAQRDRLRVDTRKWLLSKLAAPLYGDKVTQEISGPAGAPIQLAVQAAPQLEAVIAKIKSRLE